MYQPEIQSYICSINAVSPQPETVQNLHLKESITRQSSTVITVSVAWDVPEMNGEFVKYQICLTSELLAANDNPYNCKDVLEVLIILLHHNHFVCLYMNYYHL